MKKLLLILLCLPMIGFASFPIATDTKKCERIIVSLYYHVDQKIDNERSNTEIINSPLEKDGSWKVIGWLRIIFIILLSIIVIAFVLADLN
jgi:hypothetical protein